VNAILKISVLHRSIYRNVFRFNPASHLLASTLCEHGAFVCAVMAGLWLMPNTRHLMLDGRNRFKRKIYVAVAFPEIFKIAAVLLQIFDNEPTLLLMVGLLIISIQQTSLQSVTNLPLYRLNYIILSAVGVRFLMRVLFHKLSDVWMMGLVS
jgi:hypothetical protein